MQWILENWVLIVLFGGFIGVHFFMHGRGGHGGHGRNKNSDTQGHSHDDHSAPPPDDKQPEADKTPRDNA